MSRENETREGNRIAKVMARAGLCSRRDAEQWILAGRVRVNGQVLVSPAFNVGASDDVQVDGAPLPRAERTRLFLFHKPRGLVTTSRDPEGRSTIFDVLPQDLPRVVAVGRLDINTEGLLLLTNDGGLSRVLELPETGWLRRYRVRAHGTVEQVQLDALAQGVTIEGVYYRGIEAVFERQQGRNVWMTMGLREGKNREIKRVLEHLGLEVNRLIRVSFGPFELGDLPEGACVEVRTRVLREQLGYRLAQQAQVQFESASPVEVRAERAPVGGDIVRKRKHVSVLRAQAREASQGPRRRVAKAVIEDRKGRTVQVERRRGIDFGDDKAKPRFVGRRGGADVASREERGGRGAGSFRGGEAGKRGGGERRPRADVAPGREERGGGGRTVQAGGDKAKPRFVGRRGGADVASREERGGRGAGSFRGGEAGKRGGGERRPRADVAPGREERGGGGRTVQAGGDKAKPRFVGRRGGADVASREERGGRGFRGGRGVVRR